jgi:hypothetical protein
MCQVRFFAAKMNQTTVFLGISAGSGRMTFSSNYPPKLIQNDHICDSPPSLGRTLSRIPIRLNVYLTTLEDRRKLPYCECWSGQ